MGNRRGFILITTFVIMTVLTVMVFWVLSLLSSETVDLRGQIDDYKLLALADAGVDRAYRALRDNYINTVAISTTALPSGVADLRGNIATGTGVTNPNNMRYINDSVNATFTTGLPILQQFDSNYTNTRIISIAIMYRASASNTGSSLQPAYSYTAVPAYINAGAAQAITTTMTQYGPVDITNANTQNWGNIINSGNNFRLRLTRSGSNRTINLDGLWLRVTYGIDTLTESWNDTTYTNLFPITPIGSGSIQSAVITDEASKINLNYASQALIQNLLTNLSIASASTKATAIVTYRSSNTFDTVDELQRVAGITAADYLAVKDCFTVYSFVNTNSNRPAGSRAPININTVSSNVSLDHLKDIAVLKSVFDSLTLGAGDSTSLANDIITNRPFTSFYSSNSTTDFFDFVNGRAYLTATERLEVLNNADASILPPHTGTGVVSTEKTTEFCYAGTAFYIDSRARIGTRNFSVKTVRNSNGVIPSVGWRAEKFEANSA